jgi:hypothetical protein
MNVRLDAMRFSHPPAAPVLASGMKHVEKRKGNAYAILMPVPPLAFSGQFEMDRP